MSISGTLSANFKCLCIFTPAEASPNIRGHSNAEMLETKGQTKFASGLHFYFSYFNFIRRAERKLSEGEE